MNFVTEAGRIHPELVDLRRRLHAEPELRLDLPKTQAKVLEALAGLDLEVTTGRALTSVVAVLRGGRPGPVVLLRGDMDGLPIEEATGLDFASRNGAMHACGHDLHTAGLVGAARLLHAHRDELPGTVVLAFQPGEEGAGGARIMLEEGLLDAAGERPVAAYAVHVDCADPYGLYTCRPGPIMAGSGRMSLNVRGTGGHAALPFGGIDPVPVAAEIVLAIQSFVTRRIPVSDPAVVSVTGLSTDSQATNVIPSRVRVDLNIRTLSRETRQLVLTELPRTVTALAAAHGCEVDVEVVDGYPVTHNDPAETALVLAELAERAGPGRVETLPTPGMTAEDFSYILDEVPGAMYFLGARGAQVTAMHSPTAFFDDSVLGEQAATLASIAWRRLEQHDGAKSKA